MLRDYTEQIRYNEKELSKSFSERSAFGKAVTVLSVLFLLLAVVFIIYMFGLKNTDEKNYSGESDAVVYESKSDVLIE